MLSGWDNNVCYMPPYCPPQPQPPLPQPIPELYWRDNDNKVIPNLPSFHETTHQLPIKKVIRTTNKVTITIIITTVILLITALVIVIVFLN